MCRSCPELKYKYKNRSVGEELFTERVKFVCPIYNLEYTYRDLPDDPPNFCEKSNESLEKKIAQLLLSDAPPQRDSPY